MEDFGNDSTSKLALLWVTCVNTPRKPLLSLKGRNRSETLFTLKFRAFSEKNLIFLDFLGGNGKKNSYISKIGPKGRILRLAWCVKGKSFWGGMLRGFGARF